MSDLVERLRSGNPGGDSTYPTIMTEAAARIEQLEAALQRLTECLCSECHMKAFRAALEGKS